VKRVLGWGGRAVGSVIGRFLVEALWLFEFGVKRTKKKRENMRKTVQSGLLFMLCLDVQAASLPPVSPKSHPSLETIFARRTGGFLRCEDMRRSVRRSLRRQMEVAAHHRKMKQRMSVHAVLHAAKAVPTCAPNSTRHARGGAQEGHHTRKNYQHEVATQACYH